MIEAINKFKKTEDWKKEDGKFIPYPATWLNGGRWKAEIDSDIVMRVEKRWGGFLDAE